MSDGWVMSKPMTYDDEVFLEAVIIESRKARAKFPSPNLSFAALIEEIGELAKALLKNRAGHMDANEVWLEAVQVAFMAMRIATEGDPSLNSGEYTDPTP